MFLCNTGFISTPLHALRDLHQEGSHFFVCRLQEWYSIVRIPECLLHDVGYPILSMQNDVYGTRQG